MPTTRLEAFSDGVMAIIITIMALELKVPHGEPWRQALGHLWPIFLAYLLSFALIGIYWNNHHHLMHITTRISGSVLWANLHLLFWLSLVPFCTAWIGDNQFAAVPTAVYGGVQLLAAIAYRLLVVAILKSEGEGSKLGAAIGSDRKGILSTAAYVVAIPLAFVHPAISVAIFVVVALAWIIPDRRIEARL